MNTSREKLRVAVAGTSFGGQIQIPVFQTHDRTRVVAVSSGRMERAAETAKQHEIPAHYTNFEEMLDKERPDIVSIVTPPNHHFPMTMAALSRGIHVLCEKPFAMNVEEAQKMKAAADQTPVIAMVDYEFRFLPAIRHLIDLLDQGYVGEIRMVDFMVHFGVRSEPADRPWDWWSDENSGGGLLGAFGSHTVDRLRLLLGPPKRLFCDLATFVKQRSDQTVTSDDSYSLLLESQSGARASVQMSLAAGVHGARFGVYGNLGELVIPNIFGTELIGGKRGDKAIASIDIPPQYRQKDEGAPLRGPFRVLLNRMIDAVDGNHPSPAPNFDDGLNSQIMLDAARLSAKRGAWVEFP